MPRWRCTAPAPTVEFVVKIDCLIRIEYQSAEIVRPSIQCGVSTTPPDTVVAISGVRAGLPDAKVKIGYVDVGLADPPPN